MCASSIILSEVDYVSSTFSLVIYWKDDGSFSKLFTRLSVVKSDISLSTLLVVRIAVILSVSIVGDILGSSVERFKVMLNDLSPGRTVNDALFVSLTLDAIILGELR